MKVPIDRFSIIDSTNRLLKEMALDGVQPPYGVYALAQTNGRGRLEREFESPEGGIYMSFLFDYCPEVRLTAMAAVAVRRAILKVCGISCDIKWVNDLYYRGKKVCGILAEMVNGKVVLGIGVNWATDPEKLPSVAGSLGQSPQTSADFVEELACQLYGSLDAWLEEYRAADMLLGKKVDVFQAGEKTACGVASGITDEGFLIIVEENGKEMILSTGEVSVRIQE